MCSLADRLLIAVGTTDRQMKMASDQLFRPSVDESMDNYDNLVHRETILRDEIRDLTHGNGSTKDDLQRGKGEMLEVKEVVELLNTCKTDDAITIDTLQQNIAMLQDSFKSSESRISNTTDDFVRCMALNIDKFEMSDGMIRLGLKICDESLQMSFAKEGARQWQITECPPNLHLNQALVALNDSADLLAFFYHVFKTNHL